MVGGLSKMHKILGPVAHNINGSSKARPRSPGTGYTAPSGLPLGALWNPYQRVRSQNRREKNEGTPILHVRVGRPPYLGMTGPTDTAVCARGVPAQGTSRTAQLS